MEEQKEKETFSKLLKFTDNSIFSVLRENFGQRLTGCGSGRGRVVVRAVLTNDVLCTPPPELIAAYNSTASGTMYSRRPSVSGTGFAPSVLVATNATKPITPTKAIVPPAVMPNVAA